MKKKKIFLALAFLGCLTATAQNEVSQRKMTEDAFITRMKEMASGEILASISPDTTVMSLMEGKKYHVLPGETYILDNISSATYYKRKGKSFIPLCDKRFPAETIANRLLLPNRELPDGELRLKFQKYRYETDCVNIQFKQFVVFCKNEGYKAYVGIESMDDANMKVDVFLYKEDDQWLHIFNIECPLDKVSDNGLCVTGSAWLFIPTSNLRELMGKELPKDFMQKLLRRTKR